LLRAYVIVGRTIVTQIIASDDTESAANELALDLFAKLDPASVAFLLDIDGTLIDIGPSPFEVDVPEELIETLVRLSDVSGGALALVSGRPIRDLDELFAPLKLPSSAAMAPSCACPMAPCRGSTICPATCAAIWSSGDARLGVAYEDKDIRWRCTTASAAARRPPARHVAASRAKFSGVETEVLLGKAMFEVKRPGINKGDGVRAVMAQAPFTGRVPVFIGDDTTDEAAFAVLGEFGGLGFSVGGPFDGVAGVFSSPEQVRLALRRLARF